MPELAEILLSYLDVRNRNDVDAKKAILKTIADYLEDLRKSKHFKGTMYASLEDDIFAVFNKACIRHGDKKQWNLNKHEKMELYDQTFKAAIHLMQMDDIAIFQKEVSDLKQQNNP